MTSVNSSGFAGATGALQPGGAGDERGAGAPDGGREAVLPPGTAAVLGLFDDELRGLRFPDVDQAVLREAAARVQAQAEVVAQAEAALHAAREVLAECQDGLVHRCQRALAYARVFAEEDRELSRRLETIALPRAGRAARPAATATEGAEGRMPARRRGRPPGSGAQANSPLLIDPGSARPAAGSASAPGRGVGGLVTATGSATGSEPGAARVAAHTSPGGRRAAGAGIPELEIQALPETERVPEPGSEQGLDIDPCADAAGEVTGEVARFESDAA